VAIETSTIDKVAGASLRFSGFHNNALCSLSPVRPPR
jgi:hypothetical protein